MRKHLLWCGQCQEFLTPLDDRLLQNLCWECGSSLSELTIETDDMVYEDNLSVPQRYVASFLSALGLIVDTEVNVGTRRIDIYLPELDAAVEYDGPYHFSTKGEDKRDDEILYGGGIRYIFHLSDTDLVSMSKLRGQVEGAT